MPGSHVLFGIVFLSLLVLVPAVPATIVLSTAAFTPDAPLVPDTRQHVVAHYTIIPSGATTFARGHELQMETGLLDARWNIQVTLDGRNAAQQGATGSAAFVNGELLSYSTNHDVGMVVTIDGMVPPGTTGQLIVLKVEEIDNSGQVVPGSVITLSQPVAGAVTTAPPVPTTTAPLVTTAVPVTKTPGFAAPQALLGCCAAILLFLRRF
ncbi:MAG: hypothetical protein GYA23_12060 [Methanomicrobiales archaeon]|nr:hypothetical protein [Methanomicrobiales archaeon]